MISAAGGVGIRYYPTDIFSRLAAEKTHLYPIACWRTVLGAPIITAIGAGRRLLGAETSRAGGSDDSGRKQKWSVQSLVRDSFAPEVTNIRQNV
jgi:hypothetical protein